MVEKKEEVKNYKYAVGEIPTQTDYVIVDTENDNEQFNLLTAMAKLMNDVEEIKKTVC